VFTPDMRDYYRLEQLWGDVPRLELELDDAGSSVATG
jgi:ribosome-associated protein